MVMKTLIKNNITNQHECSQIKGSNSVSYVVLHWTARVCVCNVYSNSIMLQRDWALHNRHNMLMAKGISVTMDIVQLNLSFLSPSVSHV